jgi:hypothetical protein
MTMATSISTRPSIHKQGSLSIIDKQQQEQGTPQKQKQQPPSKRRTNQQQRGGISSILFVVLVSIASVSFYRSVHILSGEDQHLHPHQTLQLSLHDFLQSGRQVTSTNPNRLLQDPHLLHKDTSPLDINDDDVASIDQQEPPIPNPQPNSDGNSTFSACLLVMDDNHRLSEWLAYHYHVLPLRHLIIAVDPRSRTSPTKILNKWRRMGLYVEEWDDTYFLKPGIAKNVIPDDAELQVKRDRHRIRQKNFYRSCLQAMKTANRTWVTLIDTDEYLMYNHRGGSAQIYEEWEARQEERHKQLGNYPNGKKRIKLSQPPPSPAEEGGLIHYLHREQAAGNPFFQQSCISCPRLQFGAKESTQEERNHNVPTMTKTATASDGTSNGSPPVGELVVNPDRLDTLRFRKHAERQDFVKNGLSKSIIDVSRIDKFPRIESLHRPIKTLCSAPWKDEWDSGLRINHYLGSWEAYSFRDDSRRGGERSIGKSKIVLK